MYEGIVKIGMALATGRYAVYLRSSRSLGCCAGRREGGRRGESALWAKEAGATGKCRSCFCSCSCLSEGIEDGDGRGRGRVC